MANLITTVEQSFDGSWNPAYPTGNKPTDGLDVYLLFGQSNMVGRAAIRPGTDDVYTAISARTTQFGYTSQTDKAATNPLDHVDEDPGDMGMWLEFCNTIVGDLPVDRDILLVPAAEGGTSFVGNDWNPGNPNYEGAKDTLAAAMALGTGTNILKGCLWLHGETDSANSEANANLYLSRLQAMRDAMLIDYTGFSDRTPFIVGSINPAIANSTIVNTALSDFATNNTASKYVDLTDLAWFDGLHYDAPSLVTAGLRFAGEL